MIHCAPRGILLPPQPVRCLIKSAELLKIERDVFEETNLARTQPKLYASYVQEKFVTLKKKEYWEYGYIVEMEEGRKAVDEAVRFLNSVAPVNKVKMSYCLCKAAKDHA